jgi:hypothetical protein
MNRMEMWFKVVVRVQWRENLNTVIYITAP